jgi:ubiquinone/menaquinone biosynthesis C-methylase UbiE
MSKFDHFNFIGPVYDRVFGRHEDVEILEIAKPDPSDRVLDVGGGTGRVSALFQGKVSEIQIADAAPGMVRKAQARGIPVVVSQSEKLPYPSGCFDLIIMVDALHHVADQQATLNEMWRMLAAGGKIVIEEPDIQNFSVKLIALGEKLLLMRSHFLKPDRIAQMASFTGESQVEIIRKTGIAWVIIARRNEQTERSH